MSDQAGSNSLEQMSNEELLIHFASVAISYHTSNLGEGSKFFDEREKSRAELLRRLALVSQPEPRWISVSERIPEVGEWCWVVCGGHVQQVTAHLSGKGFACVDGYEWTWAIDEADPAGYEAVTHWQPIQAAPCVGDKVLTATKKGNTE